KALRRPGQVPWRTTVAFGKASTVSRNRSSRSRPANWAVSRNVSSLVTATSGAVGFSRSAAVSGRPLAAVASPPASTVSGGVPSRRLHTTRRASYARLVRVGVEKLLAIDLVVGDGLLTLRRDHPVDKRLSEFVLDVGVLGGIDQDDAVLVEQALVAFDQDRE